MTGSTPGGATQIETHGIEVIPEAERSGRAREMFSLWFGGNILATYLLFGGILISLGLPLVTALAIAVAGNLAWVFVGILTSMGPEAGTATMVISRVQYGYRGTQLSCFFSWLVQVGYEGVDFALAALAAYSLADYLGWHVGTIAKAVILLAIIAISFVVGLYGKAAIFAVQKVNTWALGIASVLFVIFLIPHVHWSYHPAASLHGWPLTASILIGITVVLSGPLGYPSTAEYARYLPARTSKRAVALFTATGGFIPTVALTVVGILAATVVSPDDFTTSMRHVLPGWFYAIFLIVIVAGLMANSVYSIYSSGLTLQTMGIKLSRPKTVWFDAVVGVGISVYGVLIAANFLTVLQNFLLWSIYWLAPFYGIFMVELLTRRGGYDQRGLHAHGGGRYWYRGGVRWGAMIALGLGMASSALLSNTPYLKGPLATGLLHGGDLSAVGGFLIGGAAYWMLCVLPGRRAAAPAVQLDRAVADASVAVAAAPMQLDGATEVRG
ncbi:MAG TPA: cytosine permease [Solirubrobacteraceae bacterium]|jgi:purine-cytosine permease-like protein